MCKERISAILPITYIVAMKWQMTYPLRGILPLILVAFISCGSPVDGVPSRSLDSTLKVEMAPLPATDTVIPVGDNSRNALDWPGTYKGILPCADCPGIETVIVLMADGHFTRTSRYLERERVTPQVEKGMFTWTADGGKILLSGVSGPIHYLVGENQLIQLDMEGKPITGDIAPHFILEKMESMNTPNSAPDAPVSLTGTHWRLIELNGKPIPAAKEGQKEIYIELNKPSGMVSGSGGCNRIMGSFTLGEGGRLTFSQMASTRMMCPEGMEVEAALLKVLGEANNYSQQGETLSLNLNRMAPLAKFTAAP